MTGSMNKVRAWNGITLFSFGFRPFFFFAGIYAALAMILWIGMLQGHVSLPTEFDLVSWHAHELLFGFLGAVIAGFLLTAVPNWTGRMPMTGYPLIGLFALWLAGRFAVSFSIHISAPLAAGVDLAMPVVLVGVIAREVMIGRNWRNLPVLALVSLFVLGNALFHWEAARGDYAAQGYGFRLGIAAGVMLIALIGGRIVPSFTRNWLVKQGSDRLPTPPMQKFDVLAVLTLAVALLLWIALPDGAATGGALLIAGGLHTVRLFRWAGTGTFAEPLVWILHLGYAFVPLGALALGASLLWPDGAGQFVGPGSAQHLWMAGAVGVMVLAVMTRATLGHTNRPLTATTGTTLLYLCAVAAALSRALVDVLPLSPDLLYTISGTAWIVAFGGFALLYAPALCRARQ